MACFKDKWLVLRRFKDEWLVLRRFKDELLVLRRFKCMYSTNRSGTVGVGP